MCVNVVEILEVQNVVIVKKDSGEYLPDSAHVSSGSGSLKLRLRAAINRVRFVFWRMSLSEHA